MKSAFCSSDPTRFSIAAIVFIFFSSRINGLFVGPPTFVVQSPQCSQADGGTKLNITGKYWSTLNATAEIVGIGNISCTVSVQTDVTGLNYQALCSTLPQSISARTYHVIFYLWYSHFAPPILMVNLVFPHLLIYSPILFYASPINLNTAGGDQLTIHGDCFGSTASIYDYMQIGNLLGVPWYAWTYFSNTKIIFTTPSSSGIPLNNQPVFLDYGITEFIQVPNTVNYVENISESTTRSKN